MRLVKHWVAKLWGQKVAQEIYKSPAQAMAEQIFWREKLIATAKNTRFGQDFGFEKIQNAQDFAQHIPIQDYEGLKPYIEQIKAGAEDVLWPGRPVYFAKTSGTTSGAKYIPISKASMPYHVQSAKHAILNYIHQKQSADLIDGKMIFLQGSPVLEDINGIKTGRLSGIVAHHVPKYLQKNNLPTYASNCIEDWEQKLAAIIAETEAQDMRIISGIPPWLVMYFEQLKAKHHKNIGDLFPNLQLIITGGVNYEPYREKMQQLLGRPVDILQTFPASEGFFAYQAHPKDQDLLLLTNNGIYFEFVPLQELHQPNPKRLGLAEVQLDQDYAMILSTNAGLWAYDIGDVVRFTNLSPFKIVVSGRTKHYTSAFGEHMMAYEAEQAIQMACAKQPCQLADFHLAPQVNPSEGLPYHEWLIEFEQAPADLAAFAQDLDDAVRALNIYYNDLIQDKVLQPLKISLLQPQAFLKAAKSMGKLGGQNKNPRLANHREFAAILAPYLQASS
jgi:GH3 auxin-responsive promoter